MAQPIHGRCNKINLQLAHVLEVLDRLDLDQELDALIHVVYLANPLLQALKVSSGKLRCRSPERMLST
jgi:hypothetical protein